jgi:hypothetical protein
MAADEIFVLAVVLLCTAGLVIAEIRSRRRAQAASADGEATLTTDTVEVATEPMVSEKPQRKRQRRR